MFMDKHQKQFRSFIDKLEKNLGPQGWWPRLVVDRKSFVVKHHPGPKTQWLSKSASDQALEVAVGAILTQNTSWTNVEKALVCLAEKDLMTSAALSKARLLSIEACVRSSGYYRQKTKKLRLFAKFVEEELGGDLFKVMSSRAKPRDLPIGGALDSCSNSKIPRRSDFPRNDNLLNARKLLLSLWGIGPETADTILLYGLNRQIFVVDAYTRRLLVHLTGELSWHKCPYDDVRQFCEAASIKPSAKEFQESHALIVRWGKEHH